MKIVIEIDEEIYESIKMGMRNRDDMAEIGEAVENGTPIPDNATVGEVFCMLACKEPICETASYFTIDKKLWNSPYQKGGKE